MAAFRCACFDIGAGGPFRAAMAAQSVRVHISAMPMNAAAELNAAPSDRAGLMHLAGHVVLLTVTGLLIAWTRGSLLLPVALVLHGIVLAFLFAPLHESVHRTAFRSRWLNDSVAAVAGFLLLLPPSWFRAFHFAHHRHTQIAGLDPELEVKEVETWPDYLIHLSGWRNWKASILLILRQAWGRADAAFVPPRLEPRLVREARIMLAAYLAIAALSLALRSNAALVYWVIPVLLGQPFLRAYLLAEHTGLPLVESFWENTRTTLTGYPLRFLAWNMPFHTEHHVNPGVPFYALPELHRRERENLKAVSPGYVAFHREWQQRLNAARRA
ncbi:MAG: fatty acid desaturase [Propylenella sp.]